VSEPTFSILSINASIQFIIRNLYPNVRLDAILWNLVYFFDNYFMYRCINFTLMRTLIRKLAYITKCILVIDMEISKLLKCLTNLNYFPISMELYKFMESFITHENYKMNPTFQILSMDLL